MRPYLRKAGDHLEYQFKPKGVCSTRFDVVVNDDGVIESMEVKDGCNGNGKGVSRLVKGRSIHEIIELLDGTTCGRKPTSCPDRLAKMLAGIRDEQQKQD